jgi:hypothetical protein
MFSFVEQMSLKNGVMNMGIRLYNKMPNKIREVGKI